MVVYSKKVYPELELKDFNEHILPLVHYIEQLNFNESIELSNTLNYETEERGV